MSLYFTSLDLRAWRGLALQSKARTLILHINLILKGLEVVVLPSCAWVCNYEKYLEVCCPSPFVFTGRCKRSSIIKAKTP